MSSTNPSDSIDPPVGSDVRRSPWMYVGCGCLTLLVAGSGCVLVFVFGLFSIIKSSEPATHALELAKASPAVQAALGEPIEMGMMVQGNVNIENDQGSASLHVPVSGPAGSGVVHLEASRKGGVWNYDKAMFVPDGGGPQINLLEGEKQDAPPADFEPVLP